MTNEDVISLVQDQFSVLAPPGLPPKRKRTYKRKPKLPKEPAPKPKSKKKYKKATFKINTNFLRSDTANVRGPLVRIDEPIPAEFWADQREDINFASEFYGFTLHRLERIHNIPVESIIDIRHDLGYALNDDLNVFGDPLNGEPIPQVNIKKQWLGSSLSRETESFTYPIEVECFRENGTSLTCVTIANDTLVIPKNHIHPNSDVQAIRDSGELVVSKEFAIQQNWIEEK